ncbi:MAG: flagellar hook-basal body complex protein FliE [Bacilli bacterium]
MIQRVGMEQVMGNLMKKETTETSEAHTSFKEMLTNALGEVNRLQTVSDQYTNKLANGEEVDLTEVMIASQKSSVALQATVEIRNKALEAYQEMMRMNI